ncbi:MAG: tetratricopeptide repeat protein, partial [Elusimicrobia bacterium]|nr:tetratricopeptide repeat protein [Elusimicrobiota bacterium]
FKEDLAERMEQERVLREQGLEQLRAEKSGLEGEIVNLENQFQSRKQDWQRTIDEVTRSVNAEKNRLAVHNREYQNEIARIESELKKNNAPLLNQVEELRSLLEKERASGEKALKEKVDWLHECRQELIRQEDRARAQLAEQQVRITEDKKNADQRLTALRETFSADEKLLRDTLNEKQKSLEQIKTSLAEYAQNFEKQKSSLHNSFSREYETLHGELKTLSEQLNKQRESCAALVTEKDAQIQELNDTIERCKSEYRQQHDMHAATYEREKSAREDEYRFELDRQQTFRTQGEDEIARITREYEQYAAQKTEMEANYQQELQQLKKNLYNQMRPYFVQRDDLSKMIELEKHTWVSKRDEYDRKITALNQDYEEIQHRLEEQKEQFRSEYKRIHDDFNAKLAAADHDRLRLEEQFHNRLQELERNKQQITDDLRRMKEDHTARLGQTRQQHAEELAALQSEINALTHSFGMMQEQWPAVVRAKDDELKRCMNEVAQADQHFHEEEKKWEIRIQQLKDQSQEQLATLRTQIDTITFKQNEILREKNDSIEKIKDSSQQQIQELQMLMQQEGKHFSEEKFKLEKDIEELEWRIKDHEEVTSKQLENKNNEIQRLNATINDNDRRLSERMHQLAQEHESKKQLLNTEILHSEEQLRAAQSHMESLVNQKNNEYAILAKDYEARIDELNRELEHKKKNWDNTITKLSDAKENLSQYWEERNHHWDTTVREKDAQRSKLREELHVLDEQLSQAEREAGERYTAERDRIEQAIQHKQDELENLKTQSEQELAQRDQEMQALNKRHAEHQADIEKRIAEQEEHYAAERSKLERSIAELHERIAHCEHEQSARKSELEKKINDLELSISTKKAESELAVRAISREHTRRKRTLEDKLRDSRMRQQQLREEYEKQIEIKNNEIHALNERMNSRNERLMLEWENREAILQGIEHRLQTELEELAASFQLKRSTVTSLIEEYQKKIRDVKTELGCLPQQLEGERIRLDDQYRSEEQSLEQATAQSQHDAERYSEESADVLRKKRIEQEILQQELITRNDQIQRETNRSHDILKAAMDTAFSIKENMKQHMRVPNNDIARAEAQHIFNSGVHYFQSGQFEKAIIEFEKAHTLDTALWTAWQYQGLCYERLGMIDEALAAAQEALRIQPKNTELKTWVKNLKQIK